MKVAGIFPGHGSEYPGMLRCIREYRITGDIFKKINEVADRDIFKIAIESSGKELKKPINAQLSIFGASVCYWHLLKKDVDFYGLAGHSLGFYSALYAAGCISLEDCIRTIMKVHEAITHITKNSTGLMAAIIGLKTDEVENICRDIGGVFVSNVNSATQTVVSGNAPDVTKVCEISLRKGALNVKELPIPYALHSPKMNGVENFIKPFISQIEIREPEIPVISHINALILDRKGITDMLCKQLSKKVMWKDAVKHFTDAGIRRFLEIGPSNVLSKLVKWIDRDAESFSSEEVLNCQSA